MKLTITPKIVENRYSVIISFKEFGSKTLTSDMEEKIINDYAPKFKLSDLTFEGKYTVDEGTGKVVADNDSGDDVTLSVPNKEVAINSDLELGYTVHSKEVSSSEIGTNLKNVDKVAQAKVQLFIDVVTDKINTVITSLTSNLNDFEEEYDVELG